MRRAFTLMEMLTVISIIALISGLILAVPDAPVDPVQTAAMRLQATLIKARSLAMRNGAEYAVTFHIDSPGDGTVLRARTQEELEANSPTCGHWYAIIGPARLTDLPSTGNHPPNNVPMNYGGSHTDPNNQNNWDATDAEFQKRVLACQYGQRNYLPPGARFLALDDYETGLFSDMGYKTGSLIDRWVNSKDYPRPWFGALLPEGGSVRLHPWGGSETGIQDINDNETGVLVDSFNQRTFADEPLVHGYELDRALVFAPDGSVRQLFYGPNKVNKPGIPNEHLAKQPKHRLWPIWNNWTQVTGGYHITLCADIDERESRHQGTDLTRFPDVAAATESILPLARVFIHAQSGLTEIESGPVTPNDETAHPFARIRLDQTSFRGGNWAQYSAVEAAKLGNGPRVPYHLPEWGPTNVFNDSF